MADHVVMDVNSNNLFCKHCGAARAIVAPAPMDTFLAEMRKFNEAHTDCKKPDVMPASPVPNRELPVPAEMLTPWPGLEHWLRHGRVGASSLTLAAAITGLPLVRSSSSPTTPMDGADFERCRNLLSEVAGLVPGLRSVATRNALGIAWGPLLDKWDVLVARLDAGESLSELSLAIRACTGRE